MSVNGVSSSPLLELAAVGNQSKVPIGTPVITNKKFLNSKSIQDAMTGEALTEPFLDDFESFGTDGKQAQRDPKKNALVFLDRSTNNERQIASWSYDAENGRLIGVRRNQEVLYIEGFLRDSDMGIGPTGPRGNKGKDGEDGEDGEEGADGDIGCPGDKGEDGEVGVTGAEGDPGDIGDIGYDGCEGATGDRGRQGPAGPNGFDGARGEKGPDCDPSLTGPTGADGVALRMSVMFGQAAMSDPLNVLVGLDDDGVDALVPQGGWDGQIKTQPTSSPVKPAPAPEPGAKPGVQIRAVDETMCGAKWNYSAWSSYGIASSIPNAKGLSVLPRAEQNLKYEVQRIQIPVGLVKGSTYTIKMECAPNCMASLSLGCSQIVAQVNNGGVAQGSITVTESTGNICLRFYPNADKIPCWCAAQIIGPNGEVLYSTGQSNSTFQGIPYDDHSRGAEGTRHYL